MSDLPELNLFEEIQGIANSSDFYTFSQDEFNRTWSYYEDENAMDTKESNTWTRTTTPVNQMPTPPSSGKSSPTRDAWDPMLWHTRSLEEVELRALAAELTPLSPPLSPAVMTTVSSSEVTPVYEANASKLIVTTISAADLPVSGSVTGSNQIVLDDERSGVSSRRDPESTPSRTWQARRKSSQKESQIVSRRRGINYPPKTLSKMPAMKSQGRKKLYEMKAFSDPLREKERQNAINAKKNRDKKKGLVGTVLQQIQQLKSVNDKLNKQSQEDKRKLLAAKKQIKLLKSKLESSTCAIRST